MTAETTAGKPLTLNDLPMPEHVQRTLAERTGLTGPWQRSD
jgi:hypothetical protein